jgi:hypothetical protein
MSSAFISTPNLSRAQLESSFSGVVLLEVLHKAGRVALVDLLDR